MAFTETKILGRDVTVFAALLNTPEPPDDEEFEELAATRGLEYGPEWDTEDTTSRGTGFTRTSLVTYKNNNLSIDGLLVIDDEFQLEVRDHIQNPPVEFNEQPYAWVRIVEPRANGATLITDYPVTLSSFRVSANYENVATYTLEAQAQAEPVATDIPAPTPG